MGGVEAYQQASALNTKLNQVSRWVKRSVFHGGGGPSSSAPAQRVLEIGAVNTQLLESQGLAVRALDLHSTHPRIEQCDFLSLVPGAEAPYDAVVCSMVLNCVPDGRRRFEMLIGIRAHLRLGGKAFVTVPASCVEHSFTMTRTSFIDALAAVGLPLAGSVQARELDEHTADAVAPPESTKISYFECIAGAPSADAALRVQRARHEARQALKSGPVKSKSAGAYFDVDVGGNLGYGVRVQRSFQAGADGDAGRAAREQALCRLEFLRQVGSEEEAHAASAAGALAAAAAPAATRGTHDEEDEVDEAMGDVTDDGHGDAARAAIARQVEQAGAVAVLDYTNWRWHAGGAGWRRVTASDVTGREEGSVQAQSGWQWGIKGWQQTAPQEEELAAVDDAGGDKPRASVASAAAAAALRGVRDAGVATMANTKALLREALKAAKGKTMERSELETGVVATLVAEGMPAKKAKRLVAEKLELPIFTTKGTAIVLVGKKGAEAAPALEPPPKKRKAAAEEEPPANKKKKR